MEPSHPPPCTPKCSLSGSLAATDHTDCSHHFLQTKVTCQSPHFSSALPETRHLAADHRNPHTRGNFFEKFLELSESCQGLLPSASHSLLRRAGVHRPHELSCELSVLSCTLGPNSRSFTHALTRKSTAACPRRRWERPQQPVLSPSYTCLHHLFVGRQGHHQHSSPGSAQRLPDLCSPVCVSVAWGCWEERRGGTPGVWST